MIWEKDILQCKHFKIFFTLAMYLQHSQLSMAQSKLFMKIWENVLCFLSLPEREKKDWNCSVSCLCLKCHWT